MPEMGNVATISESDVMRTPRLGFAYAMRSIAQIVEMGWYLRDKGLNHSDSAAGAIALRFGDGFLITASNTDKYHVSDRICYLPSSESGVVDYAFDRFPAANLMLHFHYKPITFATNLDRYRTAKYTSYGTLAEAQIITAQFQQDKFAIVTATNAIGFAID
jgi:hypothetical protein